eukprot:TRINITY_DN11831_c0_g1_i1.p1 TRINITY_DN11831_c0_g1~~TRINITY_DN11831_c0_g1_i1.p1  ORF type:complete len:451 (+),score=65.89 TRINITY_DN11831_c0_g1_i1:252-1604(+)
MGQQRLRVLHGTSRRFRLAILFVLPALAVLFLMWPQASPDAPAIRAEVPYAPLKPPHAPPVPSSNLIRQQASVPLKPKPPEPPAFVRRAPRQAPTTLEPGPSLAPAVAVMTPGSPHLPAAPAMLVKPVPLAQLQVSAPVVQPTAPASPRVAVAPVAVPPASPASAHMLTFAILTVPRASGAKYVEQVAPAIAKQIQAASHIPAELIVMQPRRPDGPTGPNSLQITSIRDVIKQFPHASVLNFSPNLIDPLKPANFKHHPELTPGPSARQQTRDVAKLLQELSPRCGKAVMLLEDDFEPCTRFVELSSHAIEQASKVDSDWSGIRVSFGMNGILLQCRDLLPLARYLVEEQLNMPVDLLTDEWHMKATKKTQLALGKRRCFFYKHNLLFHIGFVSTFKDRKERSGLLCGAKLALVNSFVAGTSFQQSVCPRADISPCNDEIIASSVTNYAG